VSQRPASRAHLGSAGSECEAGSIQSLYNMSLRKVYNYGDSLTGSGEATKGFNNPLGPPACVRAPGAHVACVTIPMHAGAINPALAATSTTSGGT
jgi:hypothetical protein